MNVLRASSVLRRQLCPGSACLERDLHEEDSELAREGTLLHALDANPALDRSKLTQTQRDLLNTSARLTKEVFRRIGEEFGTADLIPDQAGFEREMFLHRGIKSLFSGHCDGWEYFAGLKLLVIAEKKFGYLSVDPASTNMQTRVYACMGAELHDCEKIVCAITQPRLSRDEQITIAAYSRKDIEASRQQLFAIWDACQQPEAPLNASESACRYCKAKVGCPAFNAKITGGLEIVEGSRGLTKAAMSSMIAQRSDDEICDLLDAISFAGFITDPVKDEARKRIPETGLGGRYKLGKESEVREVTDVPAAIEALTNRGFVMDAIRPALKMKVAAIEEAYRDAHGGTWQDAKATVNELLGDLIERHKKQPSVERVK